MAPKIHAGQVPIDMGRLEAAVESYLVERVAKVHGFCRKVSWPGRRNAPDRIIALNYLRDGRPGSRVIFVELKKPGRLRLFPSNARERAQAREHKRMREFGMTVVVIDSEAGVDELLRVDPNHRDEEIW